MAGHSQYANIKHRKDAQDNKRGKVFQKLAREIYVAVKLAGASVESNPRLKLLLTKARSVNMPKENINRAISKATNKNDNTTYEEITYEGYIAGNGAVLVHCLTDNKNRSASNIRSYFTKCGGRLAPPNAVRYLFVTCGIIAFNSNLEEEDILMVLLDYDMLSYDKTGDIVTLTVSAKQLPLVTNTLQEQGISNFVRNEVSEIATEFINIADEKQHKQISNLLAMLDDDDDVVNVVHNFANYEAK